MKKITDKQRLDWVFKNMVGQRSCGKPWQFTFQLPGLDGWNGRNGSKHFRKEIDAAIRATRREGEK